MYHEQWSQNVFLFRAYSPHAPHNFEALFTKTAPSDTASIIYSRMLEHSAGDLTRIRKSSAACGGGSDTLNAPWILIRIWPILFPLRSTRYCFFFLNVSSTTIASRGRIQNSPDPVVKGVEPQETVSPVFSPDKSLCRHVPSETSLSTYCTRGWLCVLRVEMRCFILALRWGARL